MSAHQLHLIDDTPLRDRFPRPALTQKAAPPIKPATRQSDGRFAPPQLAAHNVITDAVAAAIVAGYFASTCKLMALDVVAARGKLQLPHSPARMVNDLGYRSAAYARQLAMYLTATEGNVTQAQIAPVTGLSDAAVHKALRAVEDLRDDHSDYEALVTAVLVDVVMNDDARDQALVGRARRLARRKAK